MICPSCGKENPEGEHFCQSCGSSLTKAPPLPKVQPKSPPWKIIGIIAILLIILIAAALVFWPSGDFSEGPGEFPSPSTVPSSQDSPPNRARDWHRARNNTMISRPLTLTQKSSSQTAVRNYWISLASLQTHLTLIPIQGQSCSPSWIQWNQKNPWLYLWVGHTTGLRS